MAQAFEIPTENRTARQDLLRRPMACHRQVPGNAFQIAAPGPIQRRIGNWNMGSVSDRRKRINAALPHPATGPIPGSDNAGKVNRFWRI